MVTIDQEDDWHLSEFGRTFHSAKFKILSDPWTFGFVLAFLFGSLPLVEDRKILHSYF